MRAANPMGVIWRKVWRDLACNKLRTLLAACSIAAGVFALGLAVGARELTQRAIAEDKQSTRPAQIAFRGGAWGAATFDHAVVQAIRKEPAVAQVEGELTAAIRWKAPGEPEWRQGILIAREDYGAQRVSRVDLLNGQWPEDHAVAVERQSAGFFHLTLGANLVVKIDGGERELPVQGVVRKPYVLPPLYGAPGTFYATPKTVLWLTGREGLNKLYVRLKTVEPQETVVATRQLRGKLERMGLVVNGSGPTGIIGEFNMDDMQGQIDALYLILAVLGGLALALGAFLVVNTTSAIMLEQVWQIGVMKALGGTLARVAQVYLATALVYGGLGFAIAVPPSVLAAQAMARFLLDSTFNIIPAFTGLAFSPQAILCQALVGLIVPFVAALAPVIGGARLSAGEAMSTRGTGLDFGSSPLDRLVGELRGLPRPLALALRNALRRKVRVALTLLALVSGGLMFMIVTSVHASMLYSVERMLEGMQYDVTGVFAIPQNAGAIKNLTATVPGITRVELWDRRDAEWENAQGDHSALSLWGVPTDSQVLRPVLVAGRGLASSDDRAILLDRATAARQGAAIGDDIWLTVAGKDARWQVVGLIMNVMPGAGDAFVPFAALKNVVGGERGNILMVRTAEHDGETQARVTQALNETLLARNVEVISYRTAQQFREQSLLLFGTISGLLLTMAFVAAIVGGIGLLGMLSIGVLERQREIGVLRAIGASSRMLVGIFVGQGVVLGAASWLIAVPLSYPAGYLFSQVLGSLLFSAPLSFDYSWAGAGVWLLCVSVLSALASAWPALQATRVTVREALAYE